MRGCSDIGLRYCKLPPQSKPDTRGTPLTQVVRTQARTGRSRRLKCSTLTPRERGRITGLINL
eukprot:2026346-Rhodomonas_salina.4